MNTTTTAPAAAKLPTFRDVLPKLHAGETFWLLKPNATTYIREKNGELSRTKDRNEALVFESDAAAENFAVYACLDDRNRRACGRVGTCPVGKNAK